MTDRLPLSLLRLRKDLSKDAQAALLHRVFASDAALRAAPEGQPAHGAAINMFAPALVALPHAPAGGAADAAGAAGEVADAEGLARRNRKRDKVMRVLRRARDGQSKWFRLRGKRRADGDEGKAGEELEAEQSDGEPVAEDLETDEPVVMTFASFTGN